MSGSSLCWTTITGLSLTAEAIAAIIKSNEEIWKNYKEIKERKLLEHLQRIPTDAVTIKITQLITNFIDGIVTWRSGSKTKKLIIKKNV